MSEEISNDSYTAEPQTEIIINRLGTGCTFNVYDIKSSLWYDYQYFKGMINSSEFDKFKTQRHLRVSLMVLFAHMDSTISFVLRSSLFEAIQVSRTNNLEPRIKLINETLGLNYELPRNILLLRNYLTHFGSEKGLKKAKNESLDQNNLNQFIFKELSIEFLENFENDVVYWLDEACKKTGKARLADYLTEGFLEAMEGSYESSSTHEI